MCSTPVGPESEPNKGDFPKPKHGKDRTRVPPKSKLSGKDRITPPFFSDFSETDNRTGDAAKEVFEKAPESPPPSSSRFQRFKEKVKSKFTASKQKPEETKPKGIDVNPESIQEPALEDPKAKIIEKNSDYEKVWDFFERFLTLTAEDKTDEVLGQMAFYSLYFESQSEEIRNLFPEEMREAAESFFKSDDFELNFNKYLKKNFNEYSSTQDEIDAILKKASVRFDQDEEHRFQRDVVRGKGTTLFYDKMGEQNLMKTGYSKEDIDKVIDAISNISTGLRDDIFKRIVRLLLSQDGKGFLGVGTGALSVPGEIPLLLSNNPTSVMIRVKDVDDFTVRFIFIHKSGIAPRSENELGQSIASLNFQYIYELKYNAGKWNLTLSKPPPYISGVLKQQPTINEIKAKGEAAESALKEVKEKILEMNSVFEKVWDFFEKFLTLKPEDITEEVLDEMAVCSLYFSVQKEEIRNLLPKEMREAAESFLKRDDFKSHFNGYLKSNFKMQDELYKGVAEGILARSGKEFGPEFLAQTERELKGKQVTIHLEMNDQNKEDLIYEQGNSNQIVERVTGDITNSKDGVLKRIVQTLFTHDALMPLMSATTSFAPFGEYPLFQSNDPNQQEITIKKNKDGSIQFIYTNQSGVVPVFGHQAGVPIPENVDALAEPVATFNFQFTFKLQKKGLLKKEWTLTLEDPSPPYIT